MNDEWRRELDGRTPLVPDPRRPMAGVFRHWLHCLALSGRYGGQDVSKRVKSVLIHVKDYGALGDGKTDDTKAVRRAIRKAAKAFAADGFLRTVLFPPGVYVISRKASEAAALYVPAGVLLSPELSVFGGGDVSFEIHQPEKPEPE